MTQFTTTIIGSGSAKPRNGNLSSCQLLSYNGHLALIDCCDGACTELLRMGYSINRIEKVFITHAHGDHCLGLPCLIATMGLNRKETALHVYAPKEVFSILSPAIDAMCGKDGCDLPFWLEYHEVSLLSCYGWPAKYTDNVCEWEGLDVRAVYLKHDNRETYGYIFMEKPGKRHINMDAMQKYGIPRGAYEYVRDHDWETDDGTVIPNSLLTIPPSPPRAYGYIADTLRYEGLENLLKGVTTLYCEASFQDKDRELAEKWHHCTSSDAAMLARDARTVRRLIIGHISARYESEEESVEEAKVEFSATCYAEKNKTFTIE